MTTDKKRDIAAAARRAAVRVANSGVFFSRTKTRTPDMPEQVGGPEKGRGSD